MEEYRSSPFMIEEFMKTSVYQDFLQEVKLRREALKDELCDLDLKLSGRECDIRRGGVKVYDEMSEIFSWILGNVIADQEKEKEEVVDE